MSTSSRKAISSRRITNSRTDPASIQVCKTFTEKVSVAGLEELNSDRDCPTRLLFAFGLFVATVLTVTTSFRVVQEYFHEKSSLEITFNDDGKILFPNITVCTTAVANITAAKNMVVIPKEIDDKLKTLGIDREKLTDDTVQFMYMSMMPRNIDQKHLRYVEKIFTSTSKQFETGASEIYSRTIPACSHTLSNCYFNKQPFDCCLETVLGINDGYVCYGVPIANRFEKTFSKSDAQPTQFDVDVRMDWRHIPYIRGNDAFDGFLVIVKQPYTIMASNPVAVAPGWHATIKLARIQRRADARNCVPRSRLPNMAYLPYYDEDGKNCEMENTFVTTHKGLQCNVPVSNYFPNASSVCSFRQGYVAFMAASGQVEDEVNVGNMKVSLSEKLHEVLGSVTKECYPVCDRWQYEPIVGYSELRNINVSASDFDRNVSWSRITVLIPSSYYEQHREGERSTIYVVMCNIGKSICIYAGVSMVSFVELLAYGLHSCYLLKKKRKARKIQPASNQIELSLNQTN